MTIEASPQHRFPPDSSFDGGELDCGSGLLLLLRQHIDPLARGQLLEIRSRDSSVEGDLPAWCRLTGNELVSFTREAEQRSYLVCKGTLAERRAAPASEVRRPLSRAVPVTLLDPLPAPAPAAAIAPLSVMGIGSWPRPRWLMSALRENIERRLSEAEFESTADDAVRLAVDAQLRAGVQVLTDGEQRRDSYASFVGTRLDNCQLIPLTDLLPLVEDPGQFERELEALDVPAGEVRHPAVFGALGRSRPLAVHEYAFAQSLCALPIKVALPGPYLLTRTLWMECLAERAYTTREALARDVVRVLREELHCLLAAGAALVQLDEPVLSEVVFTGAKNTRSFMCGALSERGDAERELAFASELIAGVCAGLPPARLALHMCRGNWTPDESVALRGDYRPLLAFLSQLPVGTLFLELCTPRAGEIELLKELPERFRVGVGVVNQKRAEIEPLDEIAARVRRAIGVFGRERVLLTPDCGFATFANNPLASAEVAEKKLRAIVEAVGRLRG